MSRIIYPHEEMLYILWDETTNTFWDTCGKRLTNIFDYITPNDMFLFRNDPGSCSFPHRGDYRILCEILTDA